jgi:hypothetical protein
MRRLGAHPDPAGSDWGFFVARITARDNYSFRFSTSNVRTIT